MSLTDLLKDVCRAVIPRASAVLTCYWPQLVQPRCSRGPQCKWKDQTPCWAGSASSDGQPDGQGAPSWSLFYSRHVIDSDCSRQATMRVWNKLRSAKLIQCA